MSRHGRRDPAREGPGRLTPGENTATLGLALMFVGTPPVPANARGSAGV